MLARSIRNTSLLRKRRVNSLNKTKAKERFFGTYLQAAAFFDNIPKREKDHMHATLWKWNHIPLTKVHTVYTNKRKAKTK